MELIQVVFQIEGMKDEFRRPMMLLVKAKKEFLV